jgi:RNA polymerase sigma-70 factor (ECF subfamily)
MMPSRQTINQQVLRDPDADLMLHVRADEPEVFEQLVQRYRPRLLSFLRRLVSCREDAEDVVQEVFLRVYQARQRYEPRSKFCTWLFAIAKNLARTTNRARRGQRLVAVDSAEADPAGPRRLEEVIPAAADPPGQGLEQEELATAVRRAVGGLNGRQRQVIQLSHFEGKGQGAIARSMGLTPQAVKSLLCRARTNLRDTLQTYDPRSSGAAALEGRKRPNGPVREAGSGRACGPGTTWGCRR